jgi:hypothetical protein
MKDISEVVTSLTLSQAPDCCDPTMDYAQTLHVNIEDGGGGAFAAIETFRWAITSGDDLRALADKVDALIESYNEFGTFPKGE